MGIFDEYNEKGNLKILEKLRKRNKMRKKELERLFRKGDAIKISVNEISSATPMMCHIEIESLNPVKLEKVEQLFRKSTSLFSSYNKEIEMETKGNIIRIKIPGYKYRCSYCKKFRDYLENNIKVPVIKNENCIEFRKHDEKDYTRTESYNRVKELRKMFR